MMGFRLTDLPELDGKTSIVTGANSGIGYHAALELSRKRAHVILACRDEARGQAALTRIQREVPHASLELSLLDLTSLESVAAFAQRTLRFHDRLDLLINNAGVMAIPRGLSSDGFELQFAVNHLGHFALTGLLVERLMRAVGGRIVTVTSLAHRVGRMEFDDLNGERRYHKWRAYAQSKRANVLFAYELQHRLTRAGSGVLSLLCHPGYAATELHRPGPRLGRSPLAKLALNTSNRLFAQSAAKGAWPLIFAASSPQVEAGDLIGPRAPLALYGAPQRYAPDPASRDREQMERLWEVSCQMTGVGYDALQPEESEPKQRGAGHGDDADQHL